MLPSLAVAALCVAAVPAFSQDVKQSAEEVLSQGVAQVDSGNAPAGITSLTSALKLGGLTVSQQVLALRKLGDAVSMFESSAAAVGYYNQAIWLGAETKEEAINLYSARAEAHAEADDNVAAIGNYNAALGLSPHLTSVLFDRGRAYLRIGETEAARRDFSTVARAFDDLNPLAEYALAVTFSTTDQSGDAMNSASMAKKAAPENQMFASLLQEIEAGNVNVKARTDEMPSASIYRSVFKVDDSVAEVTPEPTQQVAQETTQEVVIEVEKTPESRMDSEESDVAAMLRERAEQKPDPEGGSADKTEVQVVLESDPTRKQVASSKPAPKSRMYTRGTNRLIDGELAAVEFLRRQGKITTAQAISVTDIEINYSTFNPGSKVYVVLGHYPSDAAAYTGWLEILEKNSHLLEGLTPRYSSFLRDASFGRQQEVYPLQVGPFHDVAASALCVDLAQNGINCTTARLTSLADTAGQK